MKERCLETIDGQIFPQTGVEICADIYNNTNNTNGANICLEVIAGKKLSAEDASICKKEGYANVIINCLEERTEEVSAYQIQLSGPNWHILPLPYNAEEEVSAYQIQLFGPNWHALPLPYNADNEFYYYIED